MKILDAPRLTLRELTEGDASFMLELLNEPSFLRFVGDRGVRTVTEARSYLLKGPMSSYARFGFGLYLVEIRDATTPIGICGLVKREALEDAGIRTTDCLTRRRLRTGTVRGRWLTTGG